MYSDRHLYRLTLLQLLDRGLAMSAARCVAAEAGVSLSQLLEMLGGLGRHNRTSEGSVDTPAERSIAAHGAARARNDLRLALGRLAEVQVGAAPTATIE